MGKIISISTIAPATKASIHALFSLLTVWFAITEGKQRGPKHVAYEGCPSTRDTYAKGTSYLSRVENGPVEVMNVIASPNVER